MPLRSAQMTVEEFRRLREPTDRTAEPFPNTTRDAPTSRLSRRRACRVKLKAMMSSSALPIWLSTFCRPRIRGGNGRKGIPLLCERLSGVLGREPRTEDGSSHAVGRLQSLVPTG
jgi:hypothetical protein